MGRRKADGFGWWNTSSWTDSSHGGGDHPSIPGVHGAQDLEDTIFYIECPGCGGGS